MKKNKICILFFKMKCVHILSTGKNKGNECGKPGTYISKYHQRVNFCEKHAKEHEDEYLHELTKFLDEEIKKKDDARAEFEAKLEERELNYSELLKRSKELVLPHMLVEKRKKEGETVVKAVDKILTSILTNYLVLRPGSMLCDFRIFPSMMRGFSREEISEELVKRGYNVFSDQESHLFARAVYLE
jgi:hypothetical protein